MLQAVATGLWWALVLAGVALMFITLVWDERRARQAERRARQAEREQQRAQQPPPTYPTVFLPGEHKRPDGTLCGYLASPSGFCNKCGTYTSEPYELTGVRL
jgi:hypothetical protein